GSEVADPQGIEGEPGASPGLGLLDMTTTLYPEKQLRRVSGTLADFSGASLGDAEPAGAVQVEGYEIHCGISTGPALDNPVAQLPHGPDGARSGDGQVIGTYLHGLFDHPQAARALLAWAGLEKATGFDYRALREQQIERLADTVEQHLDLSRLFPSLLVEEKAP
ncbi:MAG: hypothetical protein M0R02_16785, partial [Bacteroidales bacterium]|nr:hypothetical protein [Bacteroidales bacterium]